ncbi:holo-ACP synthase [Virgibacillus kekensis]|uniref:Holo-[acyl-carrier-protein] synthase n=1 Tax=Virgibacillus kekensis TaxID=202261 RepID=A0ABV9DNB6_9BACI
MIKGIGIDIIELKRIVNSMQNKRFAERILTPAERVIYEGFKGEKRKAEYLAGRFAAKEAFAKAAGEGIGKLSFQDIEIIADEKGAPKIKVERYADRTVHVSITHTDDYAAAQVIIEDRN